MSAPVTAARRREPAAPAEGGSSLRAAAILAIARGICRSQRGASPRCLCEGFGTRCHAGAIYQDMAIGAWLALRKAGLRIESDSVPPRPPLALPPPKG